MKSTFCSTAQNLKVFWSVFCGEVPHKRHSRALYGITFFWIFSGQCFFASGQCWFAFFRTMLLQVLRFPKVSVFEISKKFLFPKKSDPEVAKTGDQNSVTKKTLSEKKMTTLSEKRQKRVAKNVIPYRSRKTEKKRVYPKNTVCFAFSTSRQSTRKTRSFCAAPHKWSISQNIFRFLTQNHTQILLCASSARICANSILRI